MVSFKKGKPAPGQPSVFAMLQQSAAKKPAQPDLSAPRVIGLLQESGSAFNTQRLAETTPSLAPSKRSAAVASNVYTAVPSKKAKQSVIDPDEHEDKASYAGKDDDEDADAAWEEVTGVFEEEDEDALVPSMAAPSLPHQLPTLLCLDTSGVTDPVFRHMCDLIIGVERYDVYRAYFKAVPVQRVFEYHQAQVARIPTLQKVFDEGLWTDATALKNIGGNTRKINGQAVVGWYLEVNELKESDELALGGSMATPRHRSQASRQKLKGYVGQGNLKKRFAKHTSDLLKGVGPVHYVIGGGPDRKATHVVLGTMNSDPSLQNHPCLLSTFEMYYSLKFEVLPPSLLKEWLPKGTQLRSPDMSLGVISPLRQAGGAISGVEKRLALKAARESEDPATRAYLDKLFFEIQSKAAKGYHAAERAMGDAAYTRNTNGIRASIAARLTDAPGRFTVQTLSRDAQTA